MQNIQTLQNNKITVTINAPGLYGTKISIKELSIATVISEIKRFFENYSTRLQQHTNKEVQQLLEEKIIKLEIEKKKISKFVRGKR